MRYLKVCLIVCCICISCVLTTEVQASLYINEIMYDLKDVSDTDHEWVEIHNNGTETVPISGWKFNDGSNHTLNNPPANGGQGSLSVGPNEYVILSGDATTFLNDYPGFTGTVVDTVMSLGNTEDTLSILKADGSIVDTVTYQSSLGASGDGNTLHRFGDSLQGSIPTPGFENTSQVSEDDTNNTNEQQSSPSISVSSTGGGKTPESIKPVPVAVMINTQTKGIVGIPILFSMMATGAYKEELFTGRYEWSFGDGSTRIDTKKTEFEYTYAYPGEYVVMLDYYQYVYQTKPDATTRVTIKVIPAGLVIGTIYPDMSFDLKNTSNQEIDLRDWKIETNSGESFLFTQHLIVLPKNKVRISPKVTNFSQAFTTLVLTDPSGVVVPDVGVSTTQISTASSVSKYSVVPMNSVEKEKTATNLVSNAHTTDPTINRKALPFIAFGLLLILGAGLALYLKKPKEEDTSTSANEYDIEEFEE